MKTFRVKLFLILFLISSSSMLIWHYVNHRDDWDTVTLTWGDTERQENGKTDPIAPQKATPKPTKSKENTSIDKLLENYNTKWKKQNKNLQSMRSLLGQCCNVAPNAVVTQKNSPAGSTIRFETSKKVLPVTPTLFDVLPKDSPFQTALWDSCAVVGNGGILANSSCGKQIDSASFVIRCNLPPLTNEHEINTGKKTSLVTANPSIFFQKYGGLNKKTKQKFIQAMKLYGDALLLLPAFSYGRNMGVSLRARDTLQSSSALQAIFSNPTYLRNLAQFWRKKGIRANRLSTGIMMVSMALEICNDIHLYGFWPYATHPYTYQQLPNHYYDDKPVNKRMHAMPTEFKNLIDLHNQGVIHLHLGKCPS